METAKPLAVRMPCMLGSLGRMIFKIMSSASSVSYHTARSVLVQIDLRAHHFKKSLDLGLGLLSGMVCIQ